MSTQEKFYQKLFSDNFTIRSQKQLDQLDNMQAFKNYKDLKGFNKIVELVNKNSISKLDACMIDNLVGIIIDIDRSMRKLQAFNMRLNTIKKDDTISTDKKRYLQNVQIMKINEEHEKIEYFKEYFKRTLTFSMSDFLASYTKTENMQELAF